MKKVYAYIKKHSDLIGYIVLAVFFICLQIDIWVNLEASIESDMSSELVLANMLAQEKVLITKNWFYSTELNLLHNTTMYAFLFLISNNWAFVRIASTILLNIILYLCFAYLARKLSIKNIPWIALLILGAISKDYYKFVLLGTQYIPNISISFVSVGLIIDLFKNKNNKTKLFVLLVLTFLSSISTVRYISILHIPLLFSSIIYCLYKQKEKIKCGRFDINDNSFRLVVVCLICFIVSFIALTFNKFVLPKLGYTYRLDEVKVSYIDINFEKISTVINGWLLNFGYQTDGLQAFSISQLIIKPLFVVYFILICYSTYDILFNRQKYNKYEKFVALYFTVAFVILSAVFIFTSAFYRDRYLLSVSIFAVYLVAIFLTHLEIDWLKISLLVLIGLFSISNSFFQVKYHVENDGYVEYVEVKDILLENECYNGYCDWHWNGHNLLTELSDGKIETWVFFKDIDNQNSWLQAKSHLNETPKGKTFLLLSKDIMDYDIDDQAEKYKAWEDENHVMYIFDDLIQIREYVTGHGYKVQED